MFPCRQVFSLYLNSNNVSKFVQVMLLFIGVLEMVIRASTFLFMRSKLKSILNTLQENFDESMLFNLLQLLIKMFNFFFLKLSRAFDWTEEHLQRKKRAGPAVCQNPIVLCYWSKFGIRYWTNFVYNLSLFSQGFDYWPLQGPQWS